MEEYAPNHGHIDLKQICPLTLIRPLPYLTSYIFDLDLSVDQVWGLNIYCVYFIKSYDEYKEEKQIHKENKNRMPLPHLQSEWYKNWLSADLDRRSLPKTRNHELMNGQNTTRLTKMAYYSYTCSNVFFSVDHPVDSC